MTSLQRGYAEGISEVHDLRLAQRQMLDLIEWLYVRDKKGGKDVSGRLKEIDLLRDLLRDDDE